MLEYNTFVSNLWGATASDKNEKLVSKGLVNRPCFPPSQFCYVDVLFRNLRNVFNALYTHLPVASLNMVC